MYPGLFGFEFYSRSYSLFDFFLLETSFVRWFFYLVVLNPFETRSEFHSGKYFGPDVNSH